MNGWRNPFAKTIHEIKREVMTHFEYHGMYDLCDDEKFSIACEALRRRGETRSFYNITGYMKENLR